jgi:hypothetical protein
MNNKPGKYDVVKTYLRCEQCGTDTPVEVTKNIHLDEEALEQIEEFGCLFGTCSNCLGEGGATH